jgi:hypothetical protein
MAACLRHLKCFRENSKVVKRKFRNEPRAAVRKKNLQPEDVSDAAISRNAILLMTT